MDEGFEVVVVAGWVSFMIAVGIVGIDDDDEDDDDDGVGRKDRVFDGIADPAVVVVAARPPGKGIDNDDDDDVNPPGVGLSVIARKMAVTAMTCGG